MSVFLKLGKQPIANNFLTQKEFANEYFFNLQIRLDPETKLVSLVEFVDPKILFNEKYIYHSSSSKTMINHFRSIANKIKKEYKYEKILEIGSNDGIFIKNFDPNNCICVEPCSNFAEVTNNLGYFTYAKFLNSKLSEEILDKHGKFDLIYAANCFCHMQDLNNSFTIIKHLLNKDGIFIFEDPSLLEMIKRNSYDQIYDEHAHIFSLIALTGILKKFDLQIFNVEKLDTHGGSNRLYVKHHSNKDYKINNSVLIETSKEKIENLDQPTPYLKFSQQVKKSKKDLVDILEILKKKKKKIICYGATSKSSTIFNYCQIGPKIINYITDTTKEKQGKFSPGMHIPVISPQEGLTEDIDYAFLGAWNYQKEILEKEKNRKIKWITHVPFPRIL